MNKILQLTVDLIKDINIDICFTLLEVGAVKISEEEEPFYELLDYFPSSKIVGFEIDKEVCDKMNLSARDGVKYYPHALGEFNESKELYITNHPMCSSLYKPNEDLISLYHNFEAAYLKSKTTIKTITLDNFLETNNIGSLDFIKIDVQGAELDIFRGGKKALKDVLKIVCEVEFIHHYENQPLFGDVCKFLNGYDLMFNKFLGMAGRSLRPIVFNSDKNFASQHIWSDAIFIKHIQKISKLSDKKLLKLSLLAAVYESLDLTHYCLSKFDERNSSSLATKWLQKVSSGVI
ncbi:FkbM family methyltransferase [Candidatus Thioglobus sp.]|nr:FkbM family methyltransferase [Candidatus Thioglobus sp.]